jgi:hypothetical protein
MARSRHVKKSLTVKDLKALCKQKGIKGYSSWNKEKLENECLNSRRQPRRNMRNSVKRRSRRYPKRSIRRSSRTSRKRGQRRNSRRSKRNSLVKIDTKKGYCPICMEDNIDVVVGKCEHAIACKDCYKEMLKNPNPKGEILCPQCRKIIDVISPPKQQKVGRNPQGGGGGQGGSPPQFRLQRLVGSLWPLQNILFLSLLCANNKMDMKKGSRVADGTKVVKASYRNFYTKISFIYGKVLGYINAPGDINIKVFPPDFPSGYAGAEDQTPFGVNWNFLSEATENNRLVHTNNILINFKKWLNNELDTGAVMIQMQKIVDALPNDIFVIQEKYKKDDLKLSKILSGNLKEWLHGDKPLVTNVNDLVNLLFARNPMTSYGRARIVLEFLMEKNIIIKDLPRVSKEFVENLLKDLIQTF